ncbi:hypothetical protein Chor_001844 [Crotalus horridus]
MPPPCLHPCQVPNKRGFETQSSFPAQLPGFSAGRGRYIAAGPGATRCISRLVIMELGGAVGIFLGICFSCLLLISAWKRMHKEGKLPPGPTPLPFLGNILQVKTSEPFKSFLALREKYGPVFTVYLGPRRVVVLCGHDTVKEALVDQAEEFSGRGEIASIDRNFNGFGVALANGERWKQLRRFSLTTLRNFGMGKRSIEERIQEEAQYLMEEIRKTKGQLFDPTFFLSRTVSNVISSIVFGSRFDYEDKTFLSLLQMINESFIEMSTPLAQVGSNPGADLAPMCVGVGQKEKGNLSTEFNLKNLVLTTLNLFFAGTETVSSTLRYGLLFLMKYPEVEEKVHKEIDQVIGPNRLPATEDRLKMPYTDAVVHEIQRVTDIVPMGVPHTVIRDTQFRGYLLPKGTDVFPLLGSALRDPKYFSDPENFNPGHFLDENGRFKKNEAFVPFSSGTLFLALSLAGLLLLSSWQQMSRRGKMPPGPTPLPLIGNLLWVDRNNLPNSLIKLSKKYGPVYTLHLGPRRIVVLSGYEAIKEALVDQGNEFRDRGHHGTFDWIFRGQGVAFSNGEKAKQQRRFSITTLRNFGVGKRSIEERILEEAHFLLEALRSTKGRWISGAPWRAPFDPTYFLSRSVSNVISSIAFGNRFDYEDPEFLSLLTGILETFRFSSSAQGQLLDIFFGIVQHLPGSQQKSFKMFLELKEFVAKKAKAHQETLDPNSPRDFIDCFLVKTLQEEKNPDSFFSMEELVATTLAVFIGGTETVSTTLRYGFLMLLKYPEVEEKIHEEIDCVIGVNRTPTMEDRLQMPYTEAVIHEIQRFGDLLPMALPRRVTQDVQLRGYTIPKVTPVSSLPLPGNRYCFGEHLARAELFLFLTSILQHFHFKSAVPPEDIDLSPMLLGFATIPQTYEISVIPR